MAATTRIRIEAIGLPDADLSEKEKALRVLLITSLSLRNYEPPTTLGTLDNWLRSRLEYIFNTALNSGAFDNAKINAIDLDDLCSELGLFGLQPYNPTTKKGSP